MRPERRRRAAQSTGSGALPVHTRERQRLPAADDSIKARTPLPGSPGYDEAIITFVAEVAPDQFDGQPVAFHQTFNATGGLACWGAPNSNPAHDSGNSNFIYQRFQRGIMHFTSVRGRAASCWRTI